MKFVWLTSTPPQRDKAWSVVQFPCIGRWGFTNLKQTEIPDFQAVIARLKGGQDSILDVACCLGQVARKLAAEGVGPANIYSTDLSPEFLELGFDLFGDRDRFPPGAFVAADLLKPDDPGAATLDGKVTIVHANNFFHLFSWEKQVQAAARITRFLKADAKDALVFGSQIASPGAGVMKSPRGNGDTLYGHDAESMQRMWDEVGELTRTKWVVEFEWLGKLPFQIPGLPENVQRLKFSARRVS